MKRSLLRSVALIAVAAVGVLGVAACGSPDAEVKPTVTRIAVSNAPNLAAAPTDAPATEAPASAMVTEPAQDAAAGAGDTVLIEQGSQLFNQFACTSCHAVDGTRVVGPPLNGLLGAEITLTDGSTITIDEAYIRESILDPDAKARDGYSTGMMSAAVSAYHSEFEQEETMSALLAYLESLK